MRALPSGAELKTFPRCFPPKAADAFMEGLFCSWVGFCEVIAYRLGRTANGGAVNFVDATGAIEKPPK